MGLNEGSGNWSGKQLFVNIELISSYILMIAMIVIIFTGTVDILPIFGLIILLYILSFIAVQQYIMRKHSEEYAGLEILDSWTDLDHNLGEEFLYPIEKIDLFPDISPNAQKAVQDFIESMGDSSVSMEVIEDSIKELDRNLNNIKNEDIVNGIGEKNE